VVKVGEGERDCGLLCREWETEDVRQNKILGKIGQPSFHSRKHKSMGEIGHPLHEMLREGYPQRLQKDGGILMAEADGKLAAACQSQKTTPTNLVLRRVSSQHLLT
jgi:hypothetical protein